MFGKNVALCLLALSVVCSAIPFPIPMQFAAKKADDARDVVCAVSIVAAGPHIKEDNDIGTVTTNKNFVFKGYRMEFNETEDMLHIFGPSKNLLASVRTSKVGPGKGMEIWGKTIDNKRVRLITQTVNGVRSMSVQTYDMQTQAFVGPVVDVIFDKSYVGGDVQPLVFPFGLRKAGRAYTLLGSLDDLTIHANDFVFDLVDFVPVNSERGIEHRSRVALYCY